jgi:hypothetical protein
MEDIFQHFRTFLISYASSAIVLFGSAFVFSSSRKLDGLFLDLRDSPLILVVAAIIVGIHGFFTGMFLIWKNSDSLGASLTASVISMIIVALLACLGYLVVYWSLSAGPHDPKGIKAFVIISAILMRIFLYVTVFLSVPAALIGFVNSFISGLFK